MSIDDPCFSSKRTQAKLDFITIGSEMTNSQSDWLRCWHVY